MTDTPGNDAEMGAAPARKKIFATIQAKPGEYKGVLLPIIIGCALFMQTLSATVIANALPAMAVSFGVNPVHLNTAITVYLLTSAIFLPLSGWAADRFGARTVFTFAIVLFTVASILCGLSQTLWQLIGARALQGIAGSMLMPVGRLVLLKSVAKSDMVRAMAIQTIPSMLGPVVGPVIGGAIVTYASWNWIFFINVPLGIAAAFLVTTFVPNLREDIPAKLDWKGFLLTGLGLGALIFGLENIGRDVPLWIVLGLIGSGFAAAVVYVWHEKRASYAMLDISLFKIETFRASIVGGLFLRMMIGATPFLLALLLQVGLDMSALEAGLMTFFSAVGALLMKLTAQPIVRQFGFKNVLIFNCMIVAVTFMCYALFTAATPQALMSFVLLVGGFFRSLQFTALNALAFADPEPERMSRATTLSSMSQPLAQSIGIGIAALLIQLMMNITGDGRTVTAEAVAPVFAIMGAISLISLLFFVPLPANAAVEVSGHRGPRGLAREAAAQAANSGDAAEAGPAQAAISGAPRSGLAAAAQAEFAWWMNLIRPVATKAMAASKDFSAGIIKRP